MYSSSTALTCLQTAAHPSIVTVAKFCSTSCWTSRSLKVTFSAAIMVFTIPQIFFLWGLNQDGREAVWSLCVHARRANNQLQKSHIAVYAFLWDRTALHLSCLCCTMLIQPKQHFTLSGFSGWVPVDLYIVVGRIVDHSNWYELQIWNELLLRPFLIIRVVHVVVVISTFETDRNTKRALGMKPCSSPEKEPIYLKSRNGYFKSARYVFVCLFFLCDSPSGAAPPYSRSF